MGAHRLRSALYVAAILTAAFAVPAFGKASHEGWPKIDGVLTMHTHDGDGHIRCTRTTRLGGHGDDRIEGGGAADVIWGDYKPCCQPTGQHDELDGGPGRDHLYASHGWNRISGGPQRDLIHGHFGRGVIDCGGGRDKGTVHRSRPKYAYAIARRSTTALSGCGASASRAFEHG